MEQNDPVEDRRMAGREMASRVSALEVNYTRLHEDVNEVKGTLAQFGKDMHNGFEKLAGGNKVNYVPIGIGLSILMAVLSLIGNGYIRDLNRVESTQLKLMESMSEHQNSDGHGVALHISKMLQQKVNHLDEVLQREMRLLDSAMDTKIEGLDERLQNEMNLLIDAQNEKFRAVEREVFKR